MPSPPRATSRLRALRRRRSLGALGALVLLTAAAATFAVVRDSAPAGAAVSPAPSGVDFVVSQSGTVDSSCGIGIALNTPVFTSVQAALDAAAATQAIDETVYVCAGTYTENVTTNENGIDIIGTNWNPSAPASDPSIIVAADATQPIISLQGGAQTGVRVSGLTLDGGTYGVLSLATSGTGLEISDNVVTDQTLASIQTSGIDTGAISGNVITPAADADGVVTKDAYGALNIFSNTITMPAGDGVGVSLVSTSLANGTVSGLQTVGGATADKGNTISGGTTGVLLQTPDNSTGFQSYISFPTVQFNTISDVAGDGVKVQSGAVGLDVLDNTITDVGGSGIFLSGPPTANGHDLEATEVYRNTITNAGRDGVEATGYITGIYVGSLYAPWGNTITNPGDDGVSLDGFQKTAVSDQFSRDLSITSNIVANNEIVGAGDDGVTVDQAEVPWVMYNDVRDSGGDGIEVSRSDYPDVAYNNVEGNAGDGVRYDDTYGGYVWANDILGNGGDGVELTGGTSFAAVDFNIVNQNGAGIRFTGPNPELALNYSYWNNVAGNTGLDCQDQSTGIYEDEGSGVDLANDWFGNSGGTDSLPLGLCGAEVMTVTAPQYDGEVGNPYTGRVPAPPVGATGTVTWKVAVDEQGVVDLPAGLSINPSTGQITGTPTEPVEDFRFIVVATDSAGNSANYVATITIYPTLTGTDGAVAADTGSPITPFTPTVTGGNPDTTKTFTVASTTASPLPAGLVLNPTTGEVTGTPSAAGTYTVTFHVTDSSPNMEDTAALPPGSIELPANADTYTVTFTITAAPVVATGTFPVARELMPYASPPPTATGGDGGPYTWATTSPLPPGLTLNTATGVISGTPASGTKGFYPITLTATDGSGNSDSFTATLEVLGADGSPMAHPVVGGITAAFLGLGVLLLRRRRRGTAGMA